MTKEHEPPQHEKHFNIFMNGRKKQVAAQEMSFEDLVNLAYDNNPPTGENVVITVTYGRGEHDTSGTLIPGQTVRIKDGMVFNVKATDRS